MASGQGGWEQVTLSIRAAVSRFSNGTPLNFELVAAQVGGELAYTVGYERSAVSVNGGSVQPNTLRVTHIYRRENGDWKLVHRHGDHARSITAPSRRGVDAVGVTGNEINSCQR
jgi:ketosteroid isomerase-like protein